MQEFIYIYIYIFILYYNFTYYIIIFTYPNVRTITRALTSTLINDTPPTGLGISLCVTFMLNFVTLVVYGYGLADMTSGGHFGYSYAFVIISNVGQLFSISFAYLQFNQNGISFDIQLIPKF